MGAFLCQSRRALGAIAGKPLRHPRGITFQPRVLAVPEPTLPPSPPLGWFEP